MALIDCPECKREISNKAVSCPHCGCPISTPPKTEDDNGRTKCPYCSKMVLPIVTNVGGGSCSFGSREKWTCPVCKRVIHRRGCFIATATYSNDDAVEVRFLRAYRDLYLKKSVCGRALIWFYYNIAPYIAYFVDRISFLKRISRTCLDRIVARIERKTVLRREDFADNNHAHD
jgi:hypothetical protein